MSSASFRVPVRHEEVEVCGERVLAAVTEDGKAYFSPRHVCDALGITWSRQRKKIMEDDVLSSTVAEMTTVATDGKQRVMSMLPIEYANGWLFTIKKVRPELQAKLNLFRTEGYAALDAWFRKQDGSVEFVDANGNKVIAHGNEEMSRLFKALDALV